MTDVVKAAFDVRFKDVLWADFTGQQIKNLPVRVLDTSNWPEAIGVTVGTLFGDGLKGKLGVPNLMFTEIAILPVSLR